MGLQIKLGHKLLEPSIQSEVRGQSPKPKGSQLVLLHALLRKSGNSKWRSTIREQAACLRVELTGYRHRSHKP